jgi:S-adenosylmethionine synthetase
MTTTFFTSESVGRGHPDKLSDQISDTVVDFILAREPQSRVACETMTSPGLVTLAGEIGASDAAFSALKTALPQLVAGAIVKAGFSDPRFGFDPTQVAITSHLHGQSAEIANQVNRDDKAVGAGDQGIMFGYATSATPDGLPLPISLAHQLLKRLETLVDAGELPEVGPDTKSQVTVAYQGRDPSRVDTVVIAAQHTEDISLDQLSALLEKKVVRPVLAESGVNTEGVKVLINHAGTFIKGGPQADCGLTGRKIIVDTYGGWAPHGGGAFSGKDPTKVDRSAAYAARWVALHLVRAGLATEATVQLSYAIGSTQPVSLLVETHGTSNTDADLAALVMAHFDLSPGGIIDGLKLRRPIYKETATGGHFGRPEFSWEQVDEALVARLNTYRRG